MPKLGRAYNRVAGRFSRWRLFGRAPGAANIEQLPASCQPFARELFGGSRRLTDVHGNDINEILA
jgi:hypothetical protein